MALGHVFRSLAGESLPIHQIMHPRWLSHQTIESGGNPGSLRINNWCGNKRSDPPPSGLRACNAHSREWD